MIKKLAKCIRQYKTTTLLAPTYVSIEVVLEVIIPLLMASLIDKGIDAGNMNEIIKYGIILVILSFFSLLFGILAGRAAAKASTGFAANLRHDMYYNIQNFSFSNIDKFSTSSIITRLTTDVTNVQMAFQMIIRVAVRAPLMLIFSLVMAMYINLKISLIFLAAIPILGFGLCFIAMKAHPIFERVFKTYDKLNNVVQENLHGIRVVKSYVREDFEENKFNTVSGEIYKDFVKAEKLVALNAPLMEFVIYSCMLLISWFAARLIVAGDLTTGSLMTLITYIMQILISLMMLSIILIIITISRASAERVCEILSEETDIKNPKDPVLYVQDGSVKFENVSFSYAKDKKKLCLAKVNLDIKSGETVGILGGTGSSKTTLVQLIPRLYDATKGKVLVGGIDVQKYDIETLRNAVSMVLQKNELFAGTIKENLRWGNENATDDEIKEVCKLACADEFIEKFPDKYDTHIEQGGTNVSGGQKQRLCIARALLKKPKILILDDSTSAVDTKTDSLIRKAFSEYIPETTKFIIAQRVSSVMNSDKIIILDEGRVVAVGTHDELLRTNKIYQDVYYSQMERGVSDAKR